MNTNIVGRFEVLEGDFFGAKLVLKRLKQNELGRRELGFEDKPKTFTYEERMNGCALGAITLKKTTWSKMGNGCIKMEAKGEHIGADKFEYISIYAISNNDAGMVVLNKQKDVLVHKESKNYKSK